MILINSLIWNKKKTIRENYDIIKYIYIYINCIYKHVYNQIYNEN